MKQAKNKPNEKKFLNATETGRILGMSAECVCRAIENGTMPIGAVIRPERSNEKWKCRVVEDRLNKWLNGEL